METIALKKRNMLVKKFGCFRSKIYIAIQKQNYLNTTRNIVEFAKKEKGSENRKIAFEKFFDYLCKTKDIWPSEPALFDCIKNKLYVLISEYDTLKKYCYEFEFLCRWPISGETLCDKKITCDVCEEHKNVRQELKEAINDSLIQLPSQICLIIFKYSIPC